MRWIVLALVFVLGMGMTPGLAQSERTIIVMDGSGSMWGQIGGRPKLEIARETVGNVLAQIPAEREIGLIAYGHREKGNCGDIELLVPPAAGAGAAISRAVNDMRFLGKTPLSDAVRQAAEALHYTEEAATVVLVTDGLETCSADPCALATELEQAGLNFTTHVIGLGLSQTESAQVSCLASGTGGRYFDAADADGLSDALLESVAYIPQEPLPEASLDAPASASVGQALVVGWIGPAMELDTIEIGLAGDGDRWTYVYVTQGEPAELLMPGEPGEYELRYKFHDQFVIATRAITVTEAAVSMTAPDQVLAGSEVAIAWSGPDADYDNIQIAEPGSDSYLSYAYVRDNNPVLMTMPDAPGHYELRYMLADTEVIATRAIEVLPAYAVLPQAQAMPAPVPVTLAADMGDMGFNVVWSAVPVPGQDLPPEAWALSEATPDPVNADFLPGEYDVLGEAGDQVFAGRIRVEAGAENHFTIPHSAALSPSGEDAAGNGPDAPVPVEVVGVYEGAFSRWAAFPIAGQDSPIIESLASAPGIWRTQLDPGGWLIRGRHEGATGATYLGVLEVSAGMANPAMIAQPRFGATQVGDNRMCDGDLPCFVRDDETGLQLGLPIGWSMQQPVLLKTAAGVDTGEVFTIFERADREQTMVALNPRQWDAMLGPCEDIAAGRLCRSEAMAEGDLRAYHILRATLEPGRAEPVAQAALPGDLVGRIQGLELAAPEGINLLDLIAPQLAAE